MALHEPHKRGRVIAAVIVGTKFVLTTVAVSICAELKPV
jgi:hypothetical protein